ncbi:hypothetical protein EK904_006367 [Melospiza melodia maxima]|nr:hypothetical protein EK904_006367 [Melospiza melodia maxima]
MIDIVGGFFPAKKQDSLKIPCCYDYFEKKLPDSFGLNRGTFLPVAERNGILYQLQPDWDGLARKQAVLFSVED